MVDVRKLKVEATTVDITTVDMTTVDITTVDMTTVDITTVDITTVDMTTVDITTVDITTVDITIFVNNQLVAQFFFMYVYLYSIHVSDSYVFIIRRINCRINTTPGICHCVDDPACIPEGHLRRFETCKD